MEDRGGQRDPQSPNDRIQNIEQELRPKFGIKGMIFSYDGESLKIFGITIWRKKNEKVDSSSDGSDDAGIDGDELRR